METAHLVAFNLALLAAIASPGPSFLFLTKTTLASGRKAGISAAMGLALMAALWTLAALIGLDGIFRVFPWLYVVLKTVGALYLIWIAFTTWRHAKDPIGMGATPSSKRAFFSGLLVNLGNPKSVFFAAAVLVVIFPPTMTDWEKLIVFVNHLVIELTIQPAIAVLLSMGVIRRCYIAAKPVMDRITSAILGILGLRLLLSR